jgi:predicted dehydrogenase
MLIGANDASRLALIGRDHTMGHPGAQEHGLAPIGVGLIGTGTIAQRHLDALVDHPSGRAVAVFDVIPERAKTTADRYRIPNLCGSLEEMLARPDVDAVIVCTPPFAHAAPTIAALDAGKHVLCEKPFALDVAEAERMVGTAERIGRYLACCSGRYRCPQGARKAHAMIEAGDLGEVYYVRSSAFRFRGRPGHHIFPETHWFLDSQRAGGGAMMDIAVYQIDTVLWMLGSPRVKSVLATIRRVEDEPPPPGVTQDVEDHVTIMLTTEHGAGGVIETAWVANVVGADATYILGTKAGLSMNPLTLTTGAGGRRFRQEKVLDGPDGETSGPGNITQQFVDALAAGRQPETPGADALEVTRVIDAAYRSAASGQPVALV